MSLLPLLAKTADNLAQQFDQIIPDRQVLLKELSSYIRQKKNNGEAIHLVFICTHNSRRSHMAQLWTQAAAAFYNIPATYTYSGGTEATAFYPAAVKAMQALGFEIAKVDESDNPKYKVKFSADTPAIEVWSKKFDDTTNPVSGFCAIMTCSDADENCPFVPGVEKRIAITYNDPKASDNTPQQDEIYQARALQIGREMLFAFAQV